MYTVLQNTVLHFVSMKFLVLVKRKSQGKLQKLQNENKVYVLVPSYTSGFLHLRAREISKQGGL